MGLTGPQYVELTLRVHRLCILAFGTLARVGKRSN